MCWLEGKGTCQPGPASAQTFPARKRYLAAGLPSPTNHFSVPKVFVGRCNEWL